MDSPNMWRSSAENTPSSSPGLAATTHSPYRHPGASSRDNTPHSSPFLHPLQMHKVRETHKAQVEQDVITGRKIINNYEIIGELGRGVHGKVKKARNLEKNGELVAIKIIQRFSKKRRLGKVTVAPEDKTKREIAILKKIRHANVVGLLEVIDDPELKKIYMVLEYVELGEIVWRKKGVTHICQNERRRIEKEQAGANTTQDEKYLQMQERRRQRREFKRAQLARHAQAQDNYWSLEHGNDDDDESVSKSLDRHITHDSGANLSRSYGSGIARSDAISSRPGSRVPSRTGSRAHTPLPTEFDIGPIDSDNEEGDGNDKPASATRSNASNYGSASALEGTYFGSYAQEDTPYRARSPSMADSIISRMSSVDDIHDAFEDDFSYVPCFTLDQARAAFRDTVLGLEYLHYEGIVHRDIKPANLLWTKDHRIKISDFGVSYFGRPIRDGEEEYVSEADATDFDDDLELSKTVGTPAFFAPELCYTDLDAEQPKVTEQIDVWSLGITLYCLIFARIPFLGDDEWQLFRSIAKDDAYIPRRRLKAVDPAIHGSQINLAQRVGPSVGPYREDAELRYEDIDDELFDLLRRMLIKDPGERIKLREVKRHPWVIRGVDNFIGWLDDSDPSRKTSGRRIQVDRNELDRAVVPITFMERARSVMKKAVGKVMNVARSETRQETSRRRAKSSANSSGTDTAYNSPLTPILKDSRRSSIRGDEHYFASVSDLQEQMREHTTEHPLAQSVTASPALSTSETELRDPFSHHFAGQSASAGATPRPPHGAPLTKRPSPPDRTVSAAGSIQTVVHRGHSYSRSMVSNLDAIEDGNLTPGPFTDHLGGIFGGQLWIPRGRDKIAEDEESSNRTRSADRSLFNSESKHSGPSVATSHATAGGQLSHPLLHHPRPTRSPELSPTHKHIPSPLIFQKYMVHGVVASSSSPNVSKAAGPSELEKRPATASFTPEPKTPAPRVYGASTPESFERAQREQDRRRRQEHELEEKRKEFEAAQRQDPPACPPSPDDETFRLRQDDTSRVQSYSSVNSNFMSQASSSSNVYSPNSTQLGSAEQFYPSVPSLPALVSGASSVSADTEGDMLLHPGVVNQVENPLLSDTTSDGATPPARSKAPSLDAETSTIVPNTIDADTTMILSPDEDEGYQGDIPDEDDDSDSDEGLTMSRKKPPVKKDAATRSVPSSKSHENRTPVRKDTSTSIATITSIGSTDTAK